MDSNLRSIILDYLNRSDHRNSWKLELENHYDYISFSMEDTVTLMVGDKDFGISSLGLSDGLGLFYLSKGKVLNSPSASLHPSV